MHLKIESQDLDALAVKLYQGVPRFLTPRELAVRLRHEVNGFDFRTGISNEFPLSYAEALESAQRVSEKKL